MRELPTRRKVVLGVLTMGAALALLSEAPSGAAPSAPSHVAARVGHLEVIDSFLPNPARPGVAAIYLTVKNTGARSDELVSASSPVSAASMLTRENAQGTPTGMLAELRIPAHGQTSLEPGLDHLMLSKPKMKFKVGQTVLVTLHFERSGSVTLKVPVVRINPSIDQ